MNNLEDILNNYDILTKFHEVGMFSGKFPSNSKVELYNYEYNGVMIQNKLTSSDILYSQISKLHSENNQQPNLGNELQL